MSEWKQGAAARRDERATKTDAAPRRISRKNTRRWCKGKVGVEHLTEPVEWFRSLGKIYGYNRCKKCGKHVTHWSKDA